uniref:VWFD domain-containing protein n=1 Tax=Macaca mulatta TaxID=9544 RepID=A0A1D5QE93_MACMU
MGLPLAPLAAVCLALSVAGGSELQTEGRARNHGHNVCSTWGDFHYKTFDGDIFRFPGLCDYNFASDCRGSYKEFAVHLKRGPGQAGAPAGVKSILLTIKDDTIYLTRHLAVLNGAMVSTPHYSPGLLIEKSDAYTKVYSRAGLTLLWNREDALMLELDSKFRNHTCGLCGDYNGLQSYSEFLSDGVFFSPLEFGNMQKINEPDVVCEDPEETVALASCSEHRAECERLLTAEAFVDCQDLVPLEPYLRACQQDRCRCPGGDTCICSTVAEFSRQCSHAGGRPGNWRTATFCPKTCPGNLVYLESGSPCMDTCSHLEVSSLCEEHRMDGCFCPEGTVYDDIGGSGCIPVSQCHCRLHGHLYTPGQEITNGCEQCVCNAGRWVCKDLPCPGTCALEGGSHITTFDGKTYTFHGDCYYVLAKGDHNDSYALLGELAPCGSTDKQTCLKTVVLLADKKKNVVVFKSDGSVLLNELQVNLPHVTASFSVFRPSSYHIIVSMASGLRLQVQLAPVMQLFLTLDQASQGQVQGLCGNFNGLEGDDFKTASGLVEATGAGFANTWKAQSSCHDKNSFEDPCSLSKYAQHWCSQLTDANGPFSRCHAAVKPDTYYSNCMFDTCNCERSEDCLCAVLSSYVHACAAKGVQLSGWRNGVCTKPMTTCPKSMTYHYHVSTCQPTCRSLSEGDITCSVGFIPVDGCICPEGTFLDDTGKCVQASNCPCYHRGSVIPNGESLRHCSSLWLGPLTALPSPVCAAPMVFFDCRNATPGDTGAGCQKSCHTLDMTCYSPQCVPGCVCPDGLVADGEGNCITVEDCPCVHNEASYRAGQTIRVGCNTCTCDSRMWRCTDDPCLATCAVYGDGHYLTFDGQSYSFNGDCEYMLVQNHCGGKGSVQDSFRVVTENVPCGTTGTTCSKAIKIFLGGSELKLSHGKVEVTGTNESQEVPYTIRQMGIYLVVDTDIGLVLLWDKKTSIFINLSPEFKSRVCGLCGNFDDIAANDFATRSQSVVGDVLEFGNSWKLSPSCPDALVAKDPCTANPFRKSWAQRQCSILHGPTFAACHAHVEPARYYEACVNDACACDSGGDCECFCTAVAAYAQACHEAGLCVSWRTPSICPLFCDYYNPEGQCEWHYQPCGAPCLRTCRNPRGECLQDVRGLEGCYPKCPPEAPIFDEDKMQCVATCPTPPPPPPCHVHGKSYRPGAVTITTTRPTPHPAGAQTQTTFTTHVPSASTEQPTATSRGGSTATSVTQDTHNRSVTRDCHPQCTWTKWFDVDFPSPGPHGGDEETYNNIIRSGEKICRQPEEITRLQCRATSHPEVSIEHLGQVVQCSREEGLVCRNQDQQGPFKMCLNYEVRVLCCETPKGCPVMSTPVTAPSTPSGRATSPTQSTSSWQKPRTTTLVTISTTSTPQTSTISTPTTSMTSASTPRTISALTTSTTSAPTTSTSSAPTTSTTSAPTTNTTSAPTPRTTSAPTKSTTCTRKTSTTSAPTTSKTSASTTSTTSAPIPRAISAPTKSTTYTRKTSTTSTPKTSTTSAPTPRTSAPTKSTTCTRKTSTTSTPKTSTTSAPTTSMTSAHTPRTSAPTKSTKCIRKTRTTSAPITSTTSAPTTSTTSAPPPTTTSAPTKSTTFTRQTTTTSAPTTSTTSAPTTSTISTPITSTTSASTTSTTIGPGNTPTPVLTTSTISAPTTSTSSVPTGSTTSGPATIPSPVPTTSTTTAP